MPKIKANKEEKKELDYEVTIETGGETNNFETDDILKTLAGFQPNGFFQTETIIKVKKGKNTASKILNVATARRLFNNSDGLKILAQDLKSLVD